MSRPALLGVDIGGTKTLCLLVNKRLEVLQEVKFKSAPSEGLKQFTRNLLAVLRRLASHARRNRLELVGIGVGYAGTVQKGVVRSSPNLLHLEGFAIGPFLEKHLRTRVFVGNDVQLGLLAEHRLGAGKGHPNVIGVFFGTGVGGAAILNGSLYRGASGLGGGVGAILAQPVGGPEAALSHGFVDRIASKSAICAEALVMAIKDWAPYLHTQVDADLSKVSWGMLRRAIAHGDKRIEEMLRARLKVVGIALSSVVNFLNPHVLVLGGGLVETMPRLVLTEINSGLREYLVPEVRNALRVRPARLGGRAVALGAAAAALEKFEEK